MVTANARAQGGDLPDAPGKAQVMEVCTRCHAASLFVQHRSADEWSQVMGRMIGNGALMTDDQYGIVLKYLSENLSDEKTAPQSSPK